MILKWKKLNSEKKHNCNKDAIILYFIEHVYAFTYIVWVYV